MTNERMFFRMSIRVIDTLLGADLSAADYKVFIYLCKQEAFGNRFVEIPSQGEIAKELNLARATVYRAQHKLKSLGLFEFTKATFTCRNLLGAYANQPKRPKKAEYQKFLMTDYWQEVRRLVLLRDSNSCQQCTTTVNLQVHHLTYQNYGNEIEHLEDLITLCSQCHAAKH